MVCWMTDRPAANRVTSWPLKHTTRWVPGRGAGRALPARREHPAPRRVGGLARRSNEVGRVSLRVTQPLFYDSYRRNRATGSFILASRGHERHRRGRHDPGRRLTVDDSTRTSSGRPGTLGPRASAGETLGIAGSHRVVHRTVGLGEVHPRLRRRGTAGGPWAARLPARRRQPAHGAQRRPRFQTGPAARRTSGGSPRWPCLFADAGLVAVVALISPYAEARRRRPASCTRRPGSPSSRSTWPPRSTSARSRDPKGLYARATDGRDGVVHRRRRPLRAAGATGSSRWATTWTWAPPSTPCWSCWPADPGLAPASPGGQRPSSPTITT